MVKSGRLPPLNALRAFEAAARNLSFKKAAQELHVTPGAVSHQVKLLEEFLKMPLFRRLTRALELTPQALAMLPLVQEGLEHLAAAVDKGRARDAGGSLTVIAPPNFAARWLVPRLSRFTVEHPNLELHVASRPSMIDGRDEGVHAPPPEAPIDSPTAMIRFGDGRYPGSRVDELFAASYVPICSPRLINGQQPLRTPGDLRNHTLLHDDTVTEEDARPSWSDWLAAVGLSDIDSTRGPHFSDASLAFEAALEGMGVALAIKPLVRSEIEAGRLVVPFDIAAPASYAYYLVTPESAHGNPILDEFRAWLLDEAESAKK